MKNTQPCFLGCTLGLRSNLHIYKLCYLHRLPRTPLRDRRGCIIDGSVRVLLISLLHPVGCGSAGGGNSQEIRKTLTHPHRIVPQIAASMSSLCQKVSSIFPQLALQAWPKQTHIKNFWERLCDLRKVTFPHGVWIFYLQKDRLVFNSSLGLPSVNVFRINSSIKKKPNKEVTRQTFSGSS